MFTRQKKDIARTKLLWLRSWGHVKQRLRCQLTDDGEITEANENDGHLPAITHTMHVSRIKNNVFATLII